MNGGIAVCGLTSVWNSPSTSPARTLTAPISVIIDPPSAEPPVVSRSTTQNVRSRSGRPSSSKLICADQRGPALLHRAHVHDARAGYRHKPFAARRARPTS